MEHSKKLFYLFVIMLALVVLVGCGCNRPTVKSESDFTDRFKLIAPVETDDSSKNTRTTQFAYYLTEKTMATLPQSQTLFGLEAFDSEIFEAKKTELVNLINTKTIDEYAKTASDWVKDIYSTQYNGASDEIKQQFDAYVQEVAEYTLIVKLKETALTSVSTDNWSGNSIKTYQLERLNKANEAATARYSALDTTIANDVPDYDQAMIEKAQAFYDAAKVYASELNKGLNDPRPIRWELNSFGDFFVNFFNNFLILPIGYALYGVSWLLGGNYALGLIVVTLLIRTIGWPIYTRSNDMTLKMKMMEPEQAKIQEKYARRQDKESQQMMQAEMAQLYKKYGVGVGGCIMPFLQLPIFIGVFRAVQSFPYTPQFAENIKNTLFFGLDLFKDRGEMWSGQWWGVIIMCVLVAGTQILQQILTERRQKKAQDATQADIPAYRRQAVAQSQTNKSMKIFMWVMVGMMVVFVYSSQAGLGLYWLVGNLFALFQTYVGSKNSEKRLAQLKAKAQGR